MYKKARVILKKMSYRWIAEVFPGSESNEDYLPILCDHNELAESSLNNTKDNNFVFLLAAANVHFITREGMICAHG